MLTQTSVFTHAQGWSPELPTHLDSPATLILAFGAQRFGGDPAPLDDLRRGFPRSVLAGCSTAGEIAGTHVLDDSFSVAVMRFDEARLHAASTVVDAQTASGDAGRHLGARLPQAGLRAVMLLSDSLKVDGTELLGGVLPALPGEIPVFGGLAGDGSRFESTWAIDASTRRPAPGTVSAIGFYGESLRIGIGCNAGWSTFGPRRSVTRSQGNTLYELDGRPALDLYKEYLGELARGLPASALRFPLSVRRPGANRTVVRTVLAVDEAARSLTFAGDIPQGAEAQLMRANNEALIQSAADAGMQATDALGGTPASLTLSISCIGRRLVLGERTDEEIEAVVEADTHAAHVGFYSYGEISRAPGDDASGLHNQTMTVVAFGEA